MDKKNYDLKDLMEQGKYCYDCNQSSANKSIFGIK